MSDLSEHDLQAHEVFRVVQRLADARGVRVFIVGGAVRDHLLRPAMPLRDIDLVVEGDAREFAVVVNDSFKGTLQRFDRFFGAKISAPQSYSALAEIDFASTRAETYERPGALPSISLAVLEDDLRRRDFTINAMAVAVAEASALLSGASAENTPAIIDQFDGRGDIQARLIKVLHSGSFIDDPTRLFRALRYSIRFKFDLEKHTESLFYEAIEQSALASISAMRIFNEIRKVLREAQQREMLRRCVEVGLLVGWPPVSHLKKDQIMDVIQGLSESATELELLSAFYAAQLHLSSTPPSPERWGLNLSRKVVQQLRGK